MTYLLRSHQEIAFFEEDKKAHISNRHFYLKKQENNCSNTTTTQNDAPWGLSRSFAEKRLTYYFNNSLEYGVNAGKDVNVYVLDTGVNVSHEDFEGRASFLENFSNSDNEDNVGHGTHCAGIIGGKVYGIAKNSNILSIKVLDDNGEGDYSGIIRGIEYAVKHSKALGGKKGNIINMSLGGDYSMALNKAVELGIQNGLTFVAAAGNEQNDACFTSPASAKGSITVGSFNIYDYESYFSNYGKCLTLYAPGEYIESTWIGDNKATEILSGTSMSAPHVSGAIAYLMSLSDTLLSPAEAKTILYNISLKGQLKLYHPFSTPNVILHLNACL